MSGNYLAPTVFADVEPSMRIFREEIFGPVVCVTPFGDEAEAVALANATDYGLAAYIWTGDLSRAHRVAHAVEAGMTWVNSHNVRDLRTPFGGVKASGLGREGGPHSLDFYTESRIVHIPLGDTRVPRLGADHDARATRHRPGRLCRTGRDRPRRGTAVLGGPARLRRQPRHQGRAVPARIR